MKKWIWTFAVWFVAAWVAGSTIANVQNLQRIRKQQAEIQRLERDLYACGKVRELIQVMDQKEMELMSTEEYPVENFECLHCGNVQAIYPDECMSAKCVKCGHETKDERSMVRLSSSRKFPKHWKKK